MRLVADANVFISAFLKEGLTRKLWGKLEITLYCPRFLLEEYAAYASELQKRAGYSDSESLALAERLLRKVNFVSYDEFAAYLPAARTLTTDEKDETYVACALAIGADLWSRDRHLKNNRIKCWSTSELATHFGYHLK